MRFRINLTRHARPGKGVDECRPVDHRCLRIPGRCQLPFKLSAADMWSSYPVVYAVVAQTAIESARRREPMRTAVASTTSASPVSCFCCCCFCCCCCMWSSKEREEQSAANNVGTKKTIIYLTTLPQRYLAGVAGIEACWKASSFPTLVFPLVCFCYYCCCCCFNLPWSAAIYGV